MADETISVEVTPENLPSKKTLLQEKSIRFSTATAERSQKLSPNTRKEVQASISVLILEVNTVKSQFTCDLELEMRYVDETMKPPADFESDGFDFVSLTSEEAALMGLKFPKVMLENCEEFKITFESMNVNFNTNEVLLQTNWIAIYHEIMELHNFPWDRQLLRVYIEMSDIIPLHPKNWDTLKEEPFNVNENLTDFNYHGYKGVWQNSKDPAFDVTCQVTVELERNPTFYIYNYGVIIFLVVLINSASWVFEEVDNRLGYSAALFLTLTAFKFVIMTNTPVVSYLTFLDKYVLLAFFFLFLGVFENVVTSNKVKDLMGADYDAETTDDVCQLIMLFVWVLTHIILLFMSSTGLLRNSWQKVYESNNEGILYNVGNQKEALSWFSRHRPTPPEELWSRTYKVQKTGLAELLDH